jgi:hypothetical protein
LLTTVKWASTTGKPFLGAGVAPSVEVKRAELADAIDPEELTGNDDDPIARPNTSNDKREVVPETNTPKQPVEDTQLKKALEVLREKDKPALQRAA